MKKFYSFIALLLWISSSVMAEAPQDVLTLPEPQGLEFTDVTFDDGTRYYLYNPAAKLFFASGNDWNTRASVAKFGYEVWFTSSEESGAPVKPRTAPEGSYFFNDNCQHPDRTLGDKDLFTDGDGATWVDRDPANTGQTDFYWTVTKVGDSYRIQNTSYAAKEGNAGKYLGWSGIGSGTRLYMLTPEEGFVDWKFVKASSYEEFVLSDAYTAYVYNYINVDGIYYTIAGDNVGVSGINTNIGTVVIPASISFNDKTYNVTSIGESAFAGCTELTSITIPSSVTSIGASIFSGCTALENIIVDEDNLKYDSRDDCNAIVEKGTNTLIAGCKNTAIPNTVTSIGTSAFSGCSALVSITIPNNVTTIYNSSFSGCSNLSNITLETTNVGSWFSGNNSITTVVLTDDVTSISNNAFNNCSSLASITIPSTVVNIGDAAFSGCKSLLFITLGDNIPTVTSEVLTGSATMVYVPVSRLDAYKNADGWSSYASRILPIGTQISYDLNVTAREDDSDIHAQIGESNLDHVIELKLTGSINSYDIMILRDKMPNLHKLDLTNANIETSSYAYITGYKTKKDSWLYGMCPSSLTILKLPSSLKTIGDYAFENINQLVGLEIPEGVENIGMGAFHGCSLITNIPKSVTSIGDGAFHNCSGLVSLDFSGTDISSIGNFAFWDCPNLKTIDLSNAIIGTIGDFAFINCNKLESVIAQKATINRISQASFCGGRSSSFLWVFTGMT